MISLFFLLLAATTPPASTSSPKPAAVTPSSSSKDAAAWAAKVQKAYIAVKDYQADVTQQTSLKSAVTPGQTMTGKVWIAKPGKMRWEFESPEKKTIVSDGSTM